ncbi:structural protein [Xenorhabdus vietnamensis]|uniref:Structural protein n=1 Tax=Xenorhabdus vietnamensis TaxID=351656 RepID=A0A1Y2S693_9GAMM|nr:structural protein [Xenorhabdus vietnamensis]OTA14168.1 structural protein [Xenorhabdus vietnamensis]
MARGIDNHNPGNIDYNPKNKWQGQIGIETGVKNPRFCRFESPEYGIRALMKLLRNYQRDYGLKTITGIISRWAPDNENNTGAYINGVANEMNVVPHQLISTFDKPTLIALAKSIILHENGKQPYSDDVFTRAFEML